MPLDVKQNGRVVDISLSSRDNLASSARSDFFELRLKPHDVVILHPSFGCPAIAAPQHPLRLFLLADEDFRSLCDTDPETQPYNVTGNSNYPRQAGPRVKAVINTLLKIRPWSAGKQIEDKPLYPDTATALANIDCYALGDVNGAKDGRLKDKDGVLFALLRDSSRTAYGRLGAKYLFQIELKPGAMSGPAPTDEGLYEFMWLLPDPQQPKDLKCYAELQDRATQTYIQNNRVSACLAGLPVAYRLDKDGVDFSFEPNDELPIRNRHPILVTRKAQLNLGHLTDVHVSSRQLAFRQSTAEVLQPLDGKSTPQRLGELVNVTFETLKNLLDQMAKDKEIDALALTGDLIDFNRNYDPASSPDWKEHFSVPGNLWEAMHRDHHEDDKTCPRYIDDILVYSLLDQFYQKGKLVFMVSGNHEAYDLPYGISPRVVKPNPLTPAGAKRANEGVPADHNLTIYEALLLYGPEYHVYHKAWNFDKSRLPWFYTVFTPFTDFIVQNQEQCFVGLGWGDDEDIFGNLMGGVLPRSTHALTDAQKDLVEQATQTGSERVLMTHFTLASYAPDIGLKAQGKIDCNNHLQWYSDYEQGSFKENRKALYQWIGDNKFKATLSGHSHRAALYEPNYDGGVFRDTLHTVGYEIEHEHGMDIPFQGKPALIVSGCGGPIGVQNHYATDLTDKNAPKHLKGYGLDWPSGTRVQLNGALKLQRIRSTLPSAQPRFAVAMDFFDLLEERVFTKFESETDDGTFDVVINANLPKERFVEEMILVAYLNGAWAEFPLKYEKETKTYKPEPHIWDRFVRKVLNAPQDKIVFLSTSFNSDLSKKTGYTQYNFGSPWLMRAQVEKRQQPEWVGESKVMVDQPGYTIQRHNKFGEIPDFKWYKKNFKKLYPYNRKLPTSETADE